MSSTAPTAISNRPSPLPGFAILLLLQALGESLSRIFLPALPGPVIGMALLMGLLGWSTLRQIVVPVAEGLLAHLSLLFVPVGVGVILHLDVLGEHALGLLIALVLSTWIGLAVTAITLRYLWPSKEVYEGEDHG